jgi:hypothetical protein
MNLVAILIGLVILAVFLTLLYRILVKILPQLGVDGDWVNIIFGSRWPALAPRRNARRPNPPRRAPADPPGRPART